MVPLLWDRWRNFNLLGCCFLWGFCAPGFVLFFFSFLFCIRKSSVSMVPYIFIAFKMFLLTNFFDWNNKHERTQQKQFGNSERCVIYEA
jgi:hypothetical protein